MAVNFTVVGDAKRMHPSFVMRSTASDMKRSATPVCTSSASIGGRAHVRTGLALRVADNGVGIDSDVLIRGMDEHFGLQGMRERAVRISGKLTLVSSPNSGTEIN